jgi:mono/diheme cytochrome c family protein
MSPFGNSYGGPLDDDQINAIVAYIRSWEANPPVELPPEISQNLLSLSGAEIYANICSQCHGPNGEEGVGLSLTDPAFQQRSSDADIYTSISEGHAGSSMIGWEGILSPEQIDALVAFIRQMKSIQPTAVEEELPQPTATVTTESQTTTPPAFEADILPIFQAKCTMCHGSMGGWDGSSYQTTMTSGDNAPVIIPGDPEGSLLYQKLLGTQTEGAIMPPTGKLPDETINIIRDWIAAGAPEK